jgi:hypothetical protein
LSFAFALSGCRLRLSDLTVNIFQVCLCFFNCLHRDANESNALRDRHLKVISGR